MKHYKQIIQDILKDNSAKQSYKLTNIPTNMLWKLSNHPNLNIRCCVANLIDINQLPRLLNDPSIQDIIERRLKTIL